MQTIKILLADDHRIFREGLRSLLELEEDMQILCEAENGREAVSMAKEQQPDILLIDIAMPYLNGLETARQILHAKPSSRILILSAHSDAAYLERAIDLGVAGFLIKQTSVSILAKAIRAIVQGRTSFSPNFTKQLDEYKGLQGGSMLRKLRNSTLTSRETEVLQLIAEGMANKQTASELKISIKTVEKHRQSLMDKLRLHDTAALTRYAIEAGVIECSVQSTTA